MPAIRRGCKVFRIDKDLETIGWDFLVDGNNEILKNAKRHDIESSKRPHRSLGDKVGDGDYLTRVRINKGLHPSSGCIVLDLHDMG